MRRYVFLGLVIFLLLYLTGCGKKKETLQEMQEPLSIEVSPATTMPAQLEPTVPTTVALVTEKTPEVALPPQGPYKPTNQEIQTALKNAGYYTAEIDGKIGPLTQKAIKDFQAANNLQVDAKVGPKTWEVLKNYLNPLAIEPVVEKKK